MDDEKVIRLQLAQLLDGRNAHMTFDDAVADFPPEKINSRPPNVPYTIWHLVEHLRIAQWDILEFVRDPHHQSPSWPKGYWPAPDAVASIDDWNRSIEEFRADLLSVKQLALDESLSLGSELPHAPGYTYIRELLLVADHNAYHVGELAILRQIMDAW